MAIVGGGQPDDNALAAANPEISDLTIKWIVNAGPCPSATVTWRSHGKLAVHRFSGARANAIVLDVKRLRKARDLQLYLLGLIRGGVA